MPPHRAQLLLCHEKIAGSMKSIRIRHEDQFCNLSAYAWCVTCDMYVCDIHHAANHMDGHETLIEYPRQTAQPGPQGRLAR